jgi:oligosaccharide repeat unit polymerase
VVALNRRGFGVLAVLLLTLLTVTTIAALVTILYGIDTPQALTNVVLISQAIVISAFALWTKKASGTYLNAPFIIGAAIYIWHFPFFTGYYLLKTGVFTYDGNIFNIGADWTFPAIGFSSICLNLFILGSIWGQRFRISEVLSFDTSERAQKNFTKMVRNVGKYGLIASFLVILVFQVTEDGRWAGALPYMDLYVDIDYSFTYRLFHATQFFAVIFLLMFASEKMDREHLIMLLLSMFVIIFMQFLNGSRSLPFILILTLAVVYDNFQQRQSFLRLLSLICGFAALSWIVTQARGEAVGLNVFVPKNDIDFLHLFWEMGRTIGVVMMTMEFMVDESFRFGSSFFGSALTFVPLSADLLKAVMTSERPSEWLVLRADNLGAGQGYGYSLVAESYYNFWFFGCLLFLALGVLVGRYYFSFIRTGSRYHYLLAMTTAAILSLQMRNDSGAYLRTLLWGYFIILIIKTLTGKLNRYKPHES